MNGNAFITLPLGLCYMLNKRSKVDLETGNTFFIYLSLSLYLLHTFINHTHTHCMYFPLDCNIFNKVKEICCVF